MHTKRKTHAKAQQWERAFGTLSKRTASSFCVFGAQVGENEGPGRKCRKMRVETQEGPRLGSSS